MDIEPLNTHVCVHSPVIEYSVTGGYYTSYAIHLKSNNPCFNRPSSRIRRRYSEFVSLRELLVSHHPTLKTPVLPPKNYFHRFNDEFIEQRMHGLQKFLTEVLSIPVYLSDKSLHLFLQSSSSMSQINEECLGDIPAPPLIDSRVPVASYTHDCCKSSRTTEAQFYERSLHHQILNDKKATQRRIPVNISASSTGQSVLTPNKPFPIPKRNGSVDSSTLSSPSSSASSSLETSYCSSEKSKDRRVSFNDTVKIAVVTHYGISILRP